MSILSDFLDLPLSDTWAARGPSCCGLRPDRTPMTAAQKAAASLMTFEERQAAATARILRDNRAQSIVIGRPADADKTARIKRGTL